jgi:hypothetical protein
LLIDMDIVNRAGADERIIRTVAQHSSVASESFVLFLDDKVNTVCADAARKNLEQHPTWQHMQPGWKKDATGENDTHACAVSRRIIADQKLPAWVIAAIGAYDLLAYLDATWTRAGEMDFVVTLAHELRHAWQYFNAPVVFHSQTPLSWVTAPQLTPCELDCEKTAKRVLREIYGDEAMRAYLDAELVRCKPEHRETTERLTALDPTADPNLEANTIELLEQHAAEIRNYQREHNFVMRGIPELTEVLRGRSDVRLRP